MILYTSSSNPKQDIKAKQFGFNLGRLPKNKCKIFFIAISKTTNPTITKTFKQKYRVPKQKLKANLN